MTVPLFTLFILSCAQTGQLTSKATDEAKGKPEQAFSPDPVPASAARSNASSITSIVVPSIKTWPKAIYRQTQPALNVSIPDFEIPVTGNGKKGRGLQAPGPENAEAISTPDPEPLSWTGIETQFLSTNFDDNGSYTDGFRFIPPDSHAAAGPNHVVNVVNVTITFHQKNGTIDFQDGLESFFSSLNPLTFTFDPKVIYDQYEDRWVVITMEQTAISSGDLADTSRMLVAVSDDSDPNGTWYFSEFDTVVSGNWADYPGFAVDEEAVYINTNLFSFAGGDYGGVRVWILEKGVGAGGFYDNGGTLILSENDPYAGGGVATTTQPSHMFGTGPAGTGVFLVSYSGLTDGVNEAIQVVRLDDPLGTPTFIQGFLSLGNIETLAGGIPDMPQSGTATLIESNDRRALDAVWRNDALWLTTTINPNSGTDSGQATAMWVKIDTTTLASLSIADTGIIGGEDIATGTYTTFPSIAVNANEDVVIGFSASAPTIFAGAYFVNRQASDAAGFTGSSVEVKAGVDSYVRTFLGPRNRWGDYSATAVDPVDGCFWVYNQWADTQGTPIFGELGRWGTAYAKTCSTPPVCDATYDINATTWTRFALPCDVDPNNSVAEVFSGLVSGDYPNTWVVYRRDSSIPLYIPLAIGDPMTQNTGYWVYTGDATQVNLSGSPTTLSDIDLSSDATNGRDNYVGFNQNATVNWNQVQVVDGANVLDYGDYDKPRGQGYDCDSPIHNQCVMSRKMQKWNGSAYQIFDGITPGSEGTLEPFDAFWVQAFKPGIKLRIPVGVAAAAVSSAPLASTVENIAPDVERGSKKPKKTKRESWYIRLLATAGDMQDPGNVFGQLDTAREGNDPHDLEETAPFGSKYLSITFTNPMFAEVNWGYTTDFRRMTKRPQGTWPFVVRAYAGISEVTIHWEGDAELFENAWLIDEQSGDMMKVSAGQSYTFDISGGEHHFRFEVGDG